MSIEKKSLISNRVASKKAIVTKPEVAKVASARLLGKTKLGGMTRLAGTTKLGGMTRLAGSTRLGGMTRLAGTTRLASATRLKMN